jgi:hypothetical protein
MNKPKKAINLFKTVLVEFQDRAEIYHSLAVAYILDDQSEKAYRAAVKSWELDPENHFFKSFVVMGAVCLRLKFGRLQFTDSSYFINSLGISE